MKLTGTIGLVAVSIVCIVALAASIYPGVLNDVLFGALLLSVIAVPIIAIVGVCTFGWLVWQGRLRRVTIPWRQGGVALLMLLGTYTLLRFYVPRRIAFMASRSAFQRLVEQAPEADNGTISLNRRLGIYLVDEYSTDPRGGIYFRVYSGADGIGPDVMSYGFCYNPNSNGSPFGASQYRTFKMGNGWYWFRASDDWY